MKLYLFISNAENFYKKDFGNCFRVEDDPELIADVFPDWILNSEIEVDVESIASADIAQAAVTNLENEITKTRAEMQNKIDKLETRKANLLSLEHKTEIPA